MKIVKIAMNVHQRLSVFKAKMGFNTFSEAIDYMLSKEDGVS